MNQIIREIEAEQLKENVDSFNVGDTVICQVINVLKSWVMQRI